MLINSEEKRKFEKTVTAELVNVVYLTGLVKMYLATANKFFYQWATK